MTMLRNKRVLWWAVTLIFLTDCIRGNDDGEIPITDLPPPTNIRHPPFSLALAVTPTSTRLMWDGPKEATNYIIAIFKVEMNELVLHQEVKNVKSRRFEFEGLDPSTSYEVVVQSVRVHLDGTQERSVQSKPYSFKTLEACKGGMHHVQCTAHCVATCEKRVALCDRRCIGGCKCPRDKPFVHNGICIDSKQCNIAGTPLTGVLERPTNLKLHRLTGSSDLVFTWDEVKGADYYTVLVMTEDGKVEQKIDNIKIPFITIKGLTPDVKYRFKVQAKYFKVSLMARGLSLSLVKPEPPLIAQKTEDGFYAKWNEFSGAKEYKLVIYDPNTNEILQVFKGLNTTYVTIKGLFPGTQYDVSLIVVTKEGEEVESDVVGLRTDGKKVEQRDDVDSAEITFVVQPVLTTTTTTTAAPTTTEDSIPTCEVRRSGLIAFRQGDPNLDEHIPACDSKGNYRPSQCEKDKGCYCVKLITGEKRPGSDFKSRDSEYALDCSKYGQFNIPPINFTASATSSTSIRAKWPRTSGAVFYIMKVFNSITGGLAGFASGIKKNNAVVDGLMRGTPHFVIVVGVDKHGRTSTDEAAGKYVITPHLDPPTNVRLEQINENRMKLSWTKNDVALHYRVEIYGNGKTTPEMHDNVTEDHLIIDVEGNGLYQVSIKSTGVITAPTNGQTIVVSSNPVTVTKRPSCLFRPMDVIYIIDVTSKMSPEEFVKAKELFVRLTEGLIPMSTSAKDPTGTRFAAVKVYGVAKNLFDFQRFDRPRGIVAALRFVRQTQASRLNLDAALKFVYDNYFSPLNIGELRDNVETAVISFIGGSTSESTYALEASRLRSVTKVITVGVQSPSIDKDLSRASPKNFQVKIPSYNAIDQAYVKVMEILCNLK